MDSAADSGSPRAMMTRAQLEARRPGVIRFRPSGPRPVLNKDALRAIGELGKARALFLPGFKLFA